LEKRNFRKELKESGSGMNLFGNGEGNPFQELNPYKMRGKEKPPSPAKFG